MSARVAVWWIPECGHIHAADDPLTISAHCPDGPAAHPIPAPDIDVELLARAYHRVTALADEHGNPTTDPDDVCRIDARSIAAEYARLRAGEAA